MFVLNVETQCLKFVKGHDKSVKILTVHFIGVCVWNNAAHSENIHPVFSY